MGLVVVLEGERVGGVEGGVAEEGLRGAEGYEMMNPRKSIGTYKLCMALGVDRVFGDRLSFYHQEVYPRLQCLCFRGFFTVSIHRFTHCLLDLHLLVVYRGRDKLLDLRPCSCVRSSPKHSHFFPSKQPHIPKEQHHGRKKPQPHSPPNSRLLCHPQHPVHGPP